MSRPSHLEVELGWGRYDLQLDLAPPVREALAELLETVKPLVVRALGGDAEYATELAATATEPHATRASA